MKLLVLELSFSAGTETVVLAAIRAWIKTGVEVVLAAPAHRLKHYQARGIDTAAKLEELDWPAYGWRRILRFARGRTKGVRGVERRLVSWRVGDIVRLHGATHVFLPWIFDCEPVPLPVPSAAMVMDLAWHHFDGGFSARPRSDLDARFERCLAAADIAFPVSDATQAELSRVFPKHAHKYKAVPHGSAIRSIPEVIPGGAPLFFTPASVTANKNHITLLKAARRLFADGHDFRLVLTGRDTKPLTSSTPHASEAVETCRAYLAQHEAVFAGRVETPGFVSDEEVERLYASALRVVLPSAYEGFGLPLLEAFERGVPVICSGIAPFREQIERYAMQDLAVVVDPMTEEALAAAMLQALTSPRPARLSAAEHRARLARWTWDHAAASYVRLLSTLPPK